MELVFFDPLSICISYSDLKFCNATFNICCNYFEKTSEHCFGIAETMLTIKKFNDIKYFFSIQKYNVMMKIFSIKNGL